MSEVFIVTSGDYSSYHIDAVFSTEDMAQAYIESRQWSNIPHIETWDVDADHEELDQGLKLYNVRIMFDTADVIDIVLVSNYFSTKGMTEVKPDRHWHKVYPDGNHDKHYLLVTAWAKDEQHAAKIATEKRSQFLAQQDSEVSGE